MSKLCQRKLLSKVAAAGGEPMTTGSMHPTPQPIHKKSLHNEI